MTASGRETHGRYCLPVYEDARPVMHPAYRPVVAFYLLAFVVMIASHHGLIHLARGLLVTVDVIFMASVIGFIVAMVWIRKDSRRIARDAREHGGG